MGGRNIAEPFFYERYCFIFGYIAANADDRIVRSIVFIEKIFYVFQCSLFDVPERHTDRRPAVGMYFIGQRSQMQPDISVWCIQVTLLVFLRNDLLLNMQTLRREIQVQHTVGFQPESGFNIGSRDGDVIVCIVICRISIAISAGKLYFPVEIWYIERAAEHQVLKKMGKARFIGVFVFGAYFVQYVDGYERSTCIVAA